MIRKPFSVSKIAVVTMMLVWAAKQAQAQGCSNPQYEACINSCVSTLQSCEETCGGCPGCSENFTQCSNTCENEYCN